MKKVTKNCSFLFLENMVTVELICVAVLVGILYFVNYVWKTMTYWKVRGVKHEAPLPFIGNMLKALKFNTHFFHLYDKVKNVQVYYICDFN